MRTPMMIAALACAGAPALAGVGPYTETFTSDTANWREGSFNPPTFDAGGFISTSADISTAGEFGLTLFRGHDEFDASGDAFVGDYLTAGIGTISLDVRHDADVAISFAIRVATSGNSPAFVMLSGPVAGGDWRTVSFALDPNSPFYVPEGPPGFGFFAGVMTQVGNIQVLALPPMGQPDGSFVTFDLDNVATTPTPGATLPMVAGMILATRRRRSPRRLARNAATPLGCGIPPLCPPGRCPFLHR